MNIFKSNFHCRYVSVAISDFDDIRNVIPKHKTLASDHEYMPSSNVPISIKRRRNIGYVSSLLHHLKNIP